MPQPIDFQTELSRVAAVERLQQLADRVAMNAQQRLAHEIQEQRALSESQVDEPNAKSGEVEDELKRKNPYVKRKRKRGRQDAQDNPQPKHGAPANPEDSTGEHRLDVTV